MKRLLAATCLLLLALCTVEAQTLTNLVHAAPDGAAVQLLLTDGTVLVQGNQGQDWWKLTPDNTGSYINGTWTQVARLASNYDPLYFASQVLADGRALIEGGEYNFGQFVLTNLGAVYDPAANTWTPLTAPPGWGYIGESASTMLPNGHFLIGRKLDMQVADLDPSTMTWTLLGTTGKHDFNAEEGWTLLPGGAVLTADVLDSPQSEHYIYGEQRWQTDGSTGVNLMGPPVEGCINYPGGVYCPPGEIGPAILRPDGSVFATGAFPPGGPTGHTSIYRPAANPDEPGTWTPGPDFPNGDDAGDSWAALLPSGRVLVEGNSGRLYEFDGTNLTPTLSTFGNPLILLPTGQILVGGSQVYSSPGSGVQAWAPIITNIPTSLTRGQTYRVIGRQFNGYSQAAGYGDENETATNYPLVRIVNISTGHVFYARTHGHSTMAVQTKNVPTYTNFDVPANMETGPSKLYVVANSLASNAVNVTVN